MFATSQPASGMRSLLAVFVSPQLSIDYWSVTDFIEQAQASGISGSLEIIDPKLWAIMFAYSMLEFQKGAAKPRFHNGGILNTFAKFKSKKTHYFPT